MCYGHDSKCRGGCANCGRKHNRAVLEELRVVVVGMGVRRLLTPPAEEQEVASQKHPALELHVLGMVGVHLLAPPPVAGEYAEFALTS
mmetsp:Transcript_19656/g.32610  ORF Transcript_19656/g.32610 Transcript_19656/m.32610 type:complete len:88 (-) Transcript_19656:407-670(-)